MQKKQEKTGNLNEIQAASPEDNHHRVLIYLCQGGWGLGLESWILLRDWEHVLLEGYRNSQTHSTTHRPPGLGGGLVPATDVQVIPVGAGSHAQSQSLRGRGQLKPRPPCKAEPVHLVWLVPQHKQDSFRRLSTQKGGFVFQNWRILQPQRAKTSIKGWTLCITFWNQISVQVLTSLVHIKEFKGITVPPNTDTPKARCFLWI